MEKGATIETEFWSERAPEDVFQLVASVDAMKLFRGSWLVPGIKEVLVFGHTLFVRDSWGSWNREGIVQFSRGRRLYFYIEPNPLLRRFARSLCEEWLFLPSWGGTLVKRNFFFQSPSPLLPRKHFRRTMEANNEDLRRFFARRSAPREPLLR